MHTKQSQPAIQPEDNKKHTSGNGHSVPFPSIDSSTAGTAKSKNIPAGLDPHLDKEEVSYFFKLSNTLIHDKMRPESEKYDPHFPLPIYVSTRKPVWLMSELIAWQDKLKANRDESSTRPSRYPASSGEHRHEQ